MQRPASSYLQRRCPGLTEGLGSSIARTDRPVADVRIHQRHLESSAVNAITALNDLIGASKAVQANVKMMQYHDHIMGQAVNTMGRVA